MKVLLVQNTFYIPSYGGANLSNRIIVEGLAERNHSCLALARSIGAQGPGDKAKFLIELESRGISAEFSASGLFKFRHNGVEVHALENLLQLRNHFEDQIRMFDPKWILVSSEDPGQFLLDTAIQIFPNRVIYIAHTPQAFPFGPASFYPNENGVELLRQAAAIIAIGQHTAAYIEKWSGLKPVILHPPIYRQPSFTVDSSLDRPYITIINPSAIKGITIFLELAKRLPEHPFAALIGWSTPPEDLDLLRSVPNIRIFNPVRDIDEIYSKTKILLMPSLYQEGFGLTVVEAMLRGIPVLASDYGGLVDAKLGVDYLLPIRPIEKYQNQFDNRSYPIPIIPDQDTGPWLQALRELLSNRKRYKDLSKSSRQAAVEFVKNLGIDPFEEFLENLTRSASFSAHDKKENAVSAGIAARIENLSQEKRALLALRLKEKAPENRKFQKDSIPRLPRRIGENWFTPSFAQERLWFLDQLGDPGTAYSLSIVLQLRGRVDREALEQSLLELARRHESLRTTFKTIEGELFQVVSATLEIPLEFVDLKTIRTDKRDLEVRRLEREDHQFNLSEGPLIRARLLRFNDHLYELKLALHHIISDGWSNGILCRDLGELYSARVSGKAESLTELPIQYSDFALWQRKWLQGDVLESQLSYWRKALAGSPPVLELPTDNPRPAIQTFRGKAHHFELSLSLCQSLKALSQQEGVTLFMLLLACFKLLLSRYTGSNDIVTGTPIAGRNHVETEGLVGFFVNTLVLRIDLSDNPSFRKLLSRIRKSALGAYSCQDLPFEKLVRELHPERNLSATPLFQVMFILQNAAAAIHEFSNLEVSLVDPDPESAMFDLTLSITERSEGLKGLWTYNTDLFDRSTIERMSRHYERILESIVKNPDVKISEVELLDERERHELLKEWNERKVEYPKEGCLQDLLEEESDRTPEKIAVGSGAMELSYGELNSRANQVGHYLRKLGVGAEDLVGVLMERSLEMMVGMVGILKSGGAYVPLDPNYPQERLRYMVEDAGMKVILTQEKLKGLLPEGEARVVQLDGEWSEIAKESIENPEKKSGSGNLAYVIYTSGSTGRPKGVAIEHGSAVALVYWAREEYGAEELSGVLASTSICFDLSVFEIFVPLSCGGKVILVENALGILEDSRRGEVKLINTVPSAMRELLKLGGIPESVRTVNLAGEPLTSEMVEEIYRLGTVKRVVDLYGPSEDTTYSTYQERRVGEKATIGRPIANSQVYILDKHHQPVPIGVAGEIYIGGAGLARGYLRRPELTLERFVPDGFGRERGGRLYRTGDLGRYLPDGRIEFLGRMDHQVKLRGYRIELGEIETVLRQNEGVGEATVIVREDVAGDKRLVGYVVAKRDKEVKVSELRSYMKTKLPEYMVPGTVMLLEEMPLTPNGKIDRKRLPIPEQLRPELETSYEKTQSPLEEVLVMIWSEILGMDRIGVHDNFFELGGHSLLATQLVSRMRKVFQMDIPLRNIFEAPTVRELSELLIVDKERRLRIEKTAELMLSLADLSDEEAEKMLAEKSAPEGDS